MRTLVTSGSVLVVLAALAGCGSREPQAARDPISANDPQPQRAINDPDPQTSAIGTSPQQSTNDPTRQDPAMGKHGAQQAINDPDPQKPLVAAPGSETAMNDAQILAVVVATNDSEIQLGDLGKRKATSGDVKQFATMMVSEHSDAQAKVRTVQGKAKLQLEDSDDSAKVKSEAGSTMSQLRDKTGPDFDRLFMEAMVRAHKDVLEKIDKKMMPNAQNGEVKSYVTSTRKKVADHLAKAEEIQKKIESRDTATEKANTPAPKKPTPPPAPKK